MNKASVIRIGVSTGTTIWRKIRPSPAPSTRAASSISSGMESAYWRTRKMPKMLVATGTSTPAKLLIRPISFSIRNKGSIVTWPGMTSAATSSWKMRSRPLKRNLAKA